MRRTITLIAAVAMLVAMMAGPAAAHHLVVEPPGGGNGPGEEAWVGGPPLPANGNGLFVGGPSGEFMLSAAHGGGLINACMNLRKHDRSAVDIFGPFRPTCHHGP